MINSSTTGPGRKLVDGGVCVRRGLLLPRVYTSQVRGWDILIVGLLV